MQKNLVQQLTEELNAQNKRARELQQIVDELFTIASPGALKKSLWARYQGIEGATKKQDYDPAIMDERHPYYEQGSE